MARLSERDKALNACNKYIMKERAERLLKETLKDGDTLYVQVYNSRVKGVLHIVGSLFITQDYKKVAVSIARVLDREFINGGVCFDDALGSEDYADFMARCIKDAIDVNVVCKHIESIE